MTNEGISLLESTLNIFFNHMQIFWKFPRYFHQQLSTNTRFAGDLKEWHQRYDAHSFLLSSEHCHTKYKRDITWWVRLGSVIKTSHLALTFNINVWLILMKFCTPTELDPRNHWKRQPDMLSCRCSFSAITFLS